MTRSSYWQCPECSACFEETYLLENTECPECEERVSPLRNMVTWEEFAAWCRELKVDELREELAEIVEYLAGFLKDEA